MHLDSSAGMSDVSVCWQGGQQNVTTMLLYLVDKYFRPLNLNAGPPVETPATGTQLDGG